MKRQLRIHVFGAVYGDPAEPSYITPEGIAVWMWRKGQRVRFLTAEGVQVGPEQSNVAPAMCAAAAAGWIDPANPWLSIACTLEIRRKTCRVKSSPLVRSLPPCGNTRAVVIRAAAHAPMLPAAPAAP